MAKKSEADIKLEQVGDNLRNLRINKNEKIVNVHFATGIPIGTISEIENGKHPSVIMETLSKLAAHYGSSLDEILGWKENGQIKNSINIS